MLRLATEPSDRDEWHFSRANREAVQERNDTFAT
jgi:hypothetical protein